MSIFDGNMPYTNLHELNNDWIVKTVKEVKDKAELIDESVEQAEIAENNAKTSETNAYNSYLNAEQASQNAINTYSQIQAYTNDLNNRVNINTSNIASNTSRIDSFTQLAEGSTTGDAELIDGRIGYDGFVYPNIGDAIRKQTIELHNDLSHFTMETSNLLNTNELVVNKYIGVDGSEVSSANFSHTKLLEVESGKTMYFWSKRTDNQYYYFDVRFLCCYDSNRTPIPELGGSFVGGNGVWSVPSGVSYICLSIANSYLSQWSDFYVGTREMIDYVDYIEPYGKIIDVSKAIPTVKVKSGGSLIKALKLCYKYNIRNLEVESGAYDLIAQYQAEYGQNYFTNYANYATNDPFDRGLWLENITVKFSPFARITCHYTGGNQNVTDYFSAIACGNNVTIEGLNLNASNLRYGIHADFNSGSETTYLKMKNCVLAHSRSYDNTNKIIGAGFGIHVNWEFENIIFKTTYEGYVMRVHNNVNANCYSLLTLKNCYVENGGYFVFNSYSSSEWLSPIVVNGCSFNRPIQMGKETPESNTNMILYSYCNELRD